MQQARSAELQIPGRGRNRVSLSLPEPSGAASVRLSGGANEVEVLRPARVAVRIRVSGGAGGLKFDGQHSGGTGGETVWQTPGFENATDRYEIRVRGGVNRVTVDVR